MVRTKQYILSMDEDGAFNLQPIFILELYPRRNDEILYDMRNDITYRQEREYEGRFVLDKAPDARHTATYRAVEKALIHAADLQTLEQEQEKLQILLNKSKKELMNAIFGDN